jgi:DNA modification methylase
MKTVIETRQINSLKLWDKNPRSIKENRFNELKKSITELGFNDVLKITEDGTVIGGNMRLRALQELGWTDVPVVVTTAKTDAEILRIALRDNEEFGYYEEEQVAELALAYLDPLELETFELHLGKPTKLNLLTDKFGPEIEEDEPPEVDESNVVSKLGEIYQLGRHRLMCGDSTNSDDVDMLYANNQPILMVTDPPYGVELDQSWRDKALGDKALGKGNKNIVSNDDRADWTEAWGLAKTDVAYVWHASSFADVVAQSLRSVGYDIVQQIIWNKSIMVMGRSDYHFKHEPCWYAVKHGRPHNWQGDRKQTTVWEAKSPNHIMAGSDEDKTAHPTQKPVSIMARPVKNNSKQGDLVYDPFLGSGSTLIACERTGRICYGMELDPKYCDVIRKRYTKLIDDNWEETWQEKTPAIQSAVQPA